MKNLVTSDWLVDNLNKVRVLDASWHMPNSKRNALQEFKDIHIKNSIFFDLDKTSNQKSSLPHMLPNIDNWEKTISDLFGLTPILTTRGGKLKPAGVLWGRANLIDKFSNFLIKKINYESKYRILVAHANSYDNGKKLENTLLDSLTNIENSNLLELGGGLGCHAGPGALTVGIQKIDEEI